MNFVSATDLREFIADYLDRVAAGERFHVVRHSKVVAALGPAEIETTGTAKKRTKKKGGKA